MRLLVVLFNPAGLADPVEVDTAWRDSFRQRRVCPAREYYRLITDDHGPVGEQRIYQWSNLCSQCDAGLFIAGANIEVGQQYGLPESLFRRDKRFTEIAEKDAVVGRDAVRMCGDLPVEHIEGPVRHQGAQVIEGSAVTEAKLYCVPGTVCDG